jgi:hypothetical protein
MAIPGITLGAARGLLVACGLLAVSGAGLARGIATRGIQVITIRDDTSFAGTVARLSEAPGYFDSDNLISNETAYLHAVSHLRTGRVAGGAYIGVGPDQSFSYIAAIRPSVAFMIDIRRDNLLMHLMFKALFERSSNRFEFLSRWTGRVVPADVDRWDGSPIETILAAVDSLPVNTTASETDSLVATMADMAFRFRSATRDHTPVSWRVQPLRPRPPLHEHRSIAAILLSDPAGADPPARPRWKSGELPGERRRVAVREAAGGSQPRHSRRR